MLRELLLPFGPNVIQATLCTIIAIARDFTSAFFTLVNVPPVFFCWALPFPENMCILQAFWDGS
jgi:hypothetical protein